jgi:hypothetical protein
MVREPARRRAIADPSFDAPSRDLPQETSALKVGSPTEDSLLTKITFAPVEGQLAVTLQGIAAGGYEESESEP